MSLVAYMERIPRVYTAAADCSPCTCPCTYILYSPGEKFVCTR